jgi:hypothetical protein
MKIFAALTLVLFSIGGIFSQTAPVLNISSRVKVNVTVAYVKDSPNSFGKTIAQVNKGTTLKILEIKDPWLRVSLNDSTEGWVNKIAFADRKSFVSYNGEIKAEITTTTAASRSISTAMVSGINSKLFASYKDVRKDLNFASLDEIESSQSNTDPMKKYLDFRRSGKLGEFK